VGEADVAQFGAVRFAVPIFVARNCLAIGKDESRRFQLSESEGYFHNIILPILAANNKSDLQQGGGFNGFGKI